ncbi:hypothetical protein N7522_005113 [Penicillium canescens]|uniref:Uncharacterized protein n=1 Tax=Penicillium canescens TaxID=5083 RepID=A0AAD6I9K7_PENCN|nr:uncharacterized protein N7446_005151 [Penicillium canescens]KAJ6010097.1 hypothetical protein N7522_005113 [Penicillium canescens]KAJ6038348.1 hypothetical protein N7460_008119 [Penicillium canescens]KAJ6039535.1 hypothetical protein N7444_008440 [Penicillium canescens]KAJ6068114.1 hypothetical protein N7446_005151 [Penicillium canescens]
MAPTVPNYVAFNVPVLKGSSNWNEWHEKFLRVTCAINPLYWDIFAGKLGPPKNTDFLNMHHRRAATKDDSAMHLSIQEALGQVPEIQVPDKEVCMQYDAALQQWSRSVSEAREYLLFALDRQPGLTIQGISDAREAYLELEKAYSSLHAQPLVYAWQEWLDIRYQGTQESPEGFVSRFKKALQGIKAQEIQVSLGVEIAQFQAAIMQNPECQHLVNTLRIDPQNFGDTDSVYASFIQEQTQELTLSM